MSFAKNGLAALKLAHSKSTPGLLIFRLGTVNGLSQSNLQAFLKSHKWVIVFRELPACQWGYFGNANCQMYDLCHVL